MKLKLIPLPKEKEACSSMLILGDLSPRVVDQFATLVDNVFAPLLGKAENHKDLPDVAIQDICRHVHSLRGTLYQVIKILSKSLWYFSYSRMILNEAKIHFWLMECR